MYTDELYKRSLGMSYDFERAQREVANGVAGYTGDFDRSNGFEPIDADLHIEGVRGSENAFRIQEIEIELAELLDKRQVTVEDVEKQLLLEAEKVVRLEAEVESLLQQDSIRAEALKDLFMTQLMSRAEAGQPIDAEMFAEFDELAVTIAEQNPELDADGLLRVADAMEALIVAQLTLEQHIETDQELAFA